MYYIQCTFFLFGNQCNSSVGSTWGYSMPTVALFTDRWCFYCPSLGVLVSACLFYDHFLVLIYTISLSLVLNITTKTINLSEFSSCSFQQRGETENKYIHTMKTCLQKIWVPV